MYKVIRKVAARLSVDEEQCIFDWGNSSHGVGANGISGNDISGQGAKWGTVRKETTDFRATYVQGGGTTGNMTSAVLKHDRNMA